MGVWMHGCAGVVMAVGLALLGGCGGPMTPPPPPPPTVAPEEKSPEIPGMRLTEGEISASDPQGRPLWKAMGKTIQTDEQKGIARLTQGACQLFDQGVMTLRFQADTIEVHYDAQPRTLWLKGNVIAQSPTAGWSFRAPLMTARAGNKAVEKISAANGVQVEKGNLKIRAATMTADVRLKKVLFDDAIGELTLPERKANERRSARSSALSPRSGR